MSLVSHSSSAFSAVAEAQSVLRELRERVNRANVETSRNQQEAAAVERRAEKLSKEVFEASTECITFEQECVRQAKILDEIPPRFSNSMESTDKLLEAWRQLDDQLSQLALTERDVKKEQQARRRYFSEQVKIVDRELARYRAWHSTEVARHQLMLNEVDLQKAQLMRQKSEVEENICEKENAIKQSKTALETSKQDELQWVRKLRIAQEQVEIQKTAPLAHASIDILAVQLAEELKAIAMQKKVAEDEIAAITTACETLGEQENKIEEDLLQLKLQVQQKEHELLVQRGASTARTLALEHEVAQLTKEIDQAELANAKVIQLVDTKAAALATELNGHINSETKALCEEEERLKADIDLLCKRMEQEKERWEKKILDRKTSQAKSSSTTARKPPTVGKAPKDQVNAKNIAKRRYLGDSVLTDMNGRQKPSKKNTNIPSQSSGDSSSSTDSPSVYQPKPSSKAAGAFQAAEMSKQDARNPSTSEHTVRTFSRRSSTINEAASSKLPSFAASQRPTASSAPKNDTNGPRQPFNNVLKAKEQRPSFPNQPNERVDAREQPAQKRKVPQAPKFAPNRGLTIADVIEEDQNRSSGNRKGSKKASHHRQLDPFRFRSISSTLSDGNRDSSAASASLASHDKQNPKIHNKQKPAGHKVKKSKLASGEDQSSGSQFDLFN